MTLSRARLAIRWRNAGSTTSASNRAREIVGIVRFGDEAVLVVMHQFFWAAGIGNDHWHPRGLRFDDHVAKSVGRARENKNVGRSVGRGQILSGEIAGEKRFRQRFGQFLRIGAVTNDKKLRSAILRRADVG